MNSEKQKASGELPLLRKSKEERLMAVEFLSIVGALPARPEPRYIWDSVASERRLYAGHDAVIASRSAIDSALGLHNPKALEDTAIRVARFFDRLKAAALFRYTDVVTGRLSFEQAAVRAASASSSVLREIARNLGTVRSPSDEPTIDEVDATIEALKVLRAQLRDRRAMAVAS